MLRHARSDSVSEYRSALDYFCQLRDELRRSTHDRKHFVLVPELTRRLRQRSVACRDDFRDDLARLRHAAVVYYFPSSPEIGAIISGDALEGYLAIFYALLDLGRPELMYFFRDNNLNDERMPISKEDLETCVRRRSADDLSAFCDEFYTKQFEWCPVMFDQNMAGLHNEQIVPIYRRNRIQPKRDGVPAQHSLGNTARLWAVEVPAEMISQSLKDMLPSAQLGEREFKKQTPENPVHNQGLRYIFALKTYDGDHENDFRNERRVFETLGSQKGMIQYVGWYQSRERIESGELVENYTLVLELAEFDLYQIFRNETPPICPSEISGFWDAMLDVTKALERIHCESRLGSIQLDVWHGDVKPENILRAQSRFKLADPGAATLVMSEIAADGQNPDTIAMARIRAATTTYAAPELADNDAEVSQNIDAWSLGCVLSVAASFVVLGTQGVLQYDIIRRLAFAERDITGDAFHHENKVLPEVTHWHDFLRASARRTDVITSAVLDMLDKHILIAARNRWSTKQMREKLQSIVHEHDAQPYHVPKNIEDMLQLIDQEEVSSYEQSKGINRIGTDSSVTTLLRRPSVVDERNAHPSKVDLFEQPLLLTTQRTKPRPIPISSDHSRRSHRHSGADQRPPVSHKTTISTLVQHSTNALGQNLDKIGPSTPVQGKLTLRAVPKMTIWAMLAELKRSKKPDDLTFGASWIRNNLMQNQSSRVGVEDPALAEFLEGRDLVYLVDNSSSMFGHWAQVRKWIKILVWKSLGYDKNGIEMYFTHPTRGNAIKEKPSQKVKEFIKAIEGAEPLAEPIGGVESATPLHQLEKILGRHDQTSSPSSATKKTTVLVLTDGVWHGMAQAGDVEETIRLFLKRFKARYRTRIESEMPDMTDEEIDAAAVKRLELERPITLQFIRFGEDDVGIDRLERLDDGFKPEGLPDLIDTESANGDAYKMFLGSLCPEKDEQGTQRATSEPRSADSTTDEEARYVLTSQGRPFSGHGSPRTPHRPQSIDQLASPQNFGNLGTHLPPAEVQSSRPSSSNLSVNRTMTYQLGRSDSLQPHIYGSSFSPGDGVHSPDVGGLNISQPSQGSPRRRRSFRG